MDNAQRFLNAYAAVEKSLKELTGESQYTKFYRLVEKAAKKNGLIKMHQSDLLEYAELRNAIVHQRGHNDEVIAQPVDSVVKTIEKIAERLSSDKTIEDVASKPVKTVTPETTITEAYALMRQMNTSKMPVYDEDGFTNLLTMEMIAKWGVDIANDGIDGKRQVKDIVEGFNSKEKIIFIQKDRSSQSAIEAFESNLRNGYTLLAIIVSEHGDMSEKPLGIITVADLPKLIINE